MKYVRKGQQIVDAAIPFYRVRFEDGLMRYIDAETFEREFEPVPEADKKWVVVVSYGSSNFKRSSNERTRKVFATEREAADAAKAENNDMGPGYRYKAAPLDESV